MEKKWTGLFIIQAGFNAGWGRHFTALPDSKTAEIVNIDQKSSTEIQGRFVYQTDGVYPVRGGCSNDTTSHGGEPYLYSSVYDVIDDVFRRNNLNLR